MGAARLSTTSTIAEKYGFLLERLKSYGKLAIAVSGGVDSTLLLHAALAAKGTSGVVAFHLRSPLQSERGERQFEKLLATDFPSDFLCLSITMTPFSWPEFVCNDEKRCYFCKRRMYTTLLQEMAKVQCEVLADGTNHDDLGARRPGLQAITELAVTSPLAEAQLSKKEVRQLAQSNGLSNCQQPANSCLATRLVAGLEIRPEQLRMIEHAENFLEDFGLLGCRVRLHHTCVLVEVREKDMTIITTPKIRYQVSDYLETIFSLPVALTLVGREFTAER